MKKSMASINVAIICELTTFLEEIASVPAKRQQYVSSPTAFTRKRILCFKTMALFIINTIKRSLSIELCMFLENHTCHLNCTKQAFSKGRKQLKALFFHHWNDKLVEAFYLHYSGREHRWKGFKLLAVDGSGVTLADVDELRNTYGQSSNARGTYRPACRISVLYDVLNEIALKARLQPFSESERSSCFKILEDTDLTDALLLFDRGYPSYWLFYYLLKRNAHFVFRASSNMNKDVENFIESNQTDVIIDIYPSYKSIQKLKKLRIGEISNTTQVKVRLIKVLLDTGETEVLITNLYDQVTYPHSIFKELYCKRWAIETYYGHIKEGLQLQQFSGISPICIEQDFAATLFYFNLQSVIEKQCQPMVENISKKRKHRYKVNKKVSLGLFKDKVVKLFLTPNLIDSLLELERLFCQHLQIIRPGRKFSREKKRKPDSKFYTLTNYKRAI